MVSWQVTIYDMCGCNWENYHLQHSRWCRSTTLDNKFFKIEYGFFYKRSSISDIIQYFKVVVIMSQQRHERILVASTPMLNQYRSRALKMFPRPRGIGVRAKRKSHTHHHFLRLGYPQGAWLAVWSVYSPWHGLFSITLKQLIFVSLKAVNLGLEYSTAEIEGKAN